MELILIVNIYDDELQKIIVWCSMRVGYSEELYNYILIGGFLRATALNSTCF